MDDIFQSLNSIKQNLERPDVEMANNDNNDISNLLLYLTRFIKSTMEDQINIMIQNKMEEYFNNGSLDDKIRNILMGYPEDTIINNTKTKTIIKEILQELFTNK